MKKNSSSSIKPKIVALITALLSSVMCFSIGFSIWNSGSTDTGIDGSFDADVLGDLSSIISFGNDENNSGASIFHYNSTNFTNNGEIEEYGVIKVFYKIISDADYSSGSIAFNNSLSIYNGSSKVSNLALLNSTVLPTSLISCKYNEANNATKVSFSNAVITHDSYGPVVEYSINNLTLNKIVNVTLEYKIDYSQITNFKSQVADLFDVNHYSFRFDLVVS